MSACCNESTCRRKKPIKLMRSGLTGTWYVVTDYTERVSPTPGGEPLYVAKVKHELDPAVAIQLEAMREAYRAQQEPQE